MGAIVYCIISLKNLASADGRNVPPPHCQPLSGLLPALGYPSSLFAWLKNTGNPRLHGGIACHFQRG